MSWKGWRLISDENRYHEKMMSVCGHEDGFPTKDFWASMRRTSLRSIEEGVITAVLDSEFDTHTTRLWKSKQLPEDIKAEKHKVWLLDGEESKKQRKLYLKRRYVWKKEGKINHFRSKI